MNESTHEPARDTTTEDTKPAWMTDAQFRIERIRTVVFSRLRSSHATTHSLIRACSRADIAPKPTPEEIAAACGSLNASAMAKDAQTETVWSVGVEHAEAPPLENTTTLDRRLALVALRLSLFAIGHAQLPWLSNVPVFERLARYLGASLGESTWEVMTEEMEKAEALLVEAGEMKAPDAPEKETP